MKKLIMICLGIIILGPIPLTDAANRAQAKEQIKDAHPHAVILKDTKGEVVGQAMLGEGEPGVIVYLNVKGLKPGLHGIHFHEKGVCEGPDFKSAGDHFNPYNKEHGLRNPKGPHAGDMKNVLADQNGNVQTSYIDTLVTLQKGKKNSLLDKDGASLVIHADEDDQMTNPAGNSGARVVCGVVK
ncbi:MAG TPA: superoxide dismutase family protein [Sporolactobacillaceae bacterium]|nr:superoxide dismutase family protein [Sporolactobacillaceae bacterium]